MSPLDLPQGREGHEPEEMPRGVPWVFALFILCIVGWGAYTFLTEIPKGLGPHGDHRTLTALMPPAPASAQAVAAEQAAPPDGKALYDGRCAACHQATGTGLAGAFPPLAGSEWVLGSPERMATIVLHGLKDPIEVKGATYNGVMPTFKDQLSDAELAAVISHVRSSFGNSAGAVTPELVAAERAKLERTDPIGGQEELARLFP